MGIIEKLKLHRAQQVESAMERYRRLIGEPDPDAAALDEARHAAGVSDSEAEADAEAIKTAARIEQRMTPAERTMELRKESAKQHKTAHDLARKALKLFPLDSVPDESLMDALAALMRYAKHEGKAWESFMDVELKASEALASATETLKKALDAEGRNKDAAEELARLKSRNRRLWPDAAPPDALTPLALAGTGDSGQPFTPKPTETYPGSGQGIEYVGGVPRMVPVGK